MEFRVPGEPIFLGVVWAGYAKHPKMGRKVLLNNQESLRVVKESLMPPQP